MDSKFDEMIDRYHTNCAKWDEADEIYGKDLIHLGVADMDFKSPEPVIQTMQNVLDHGVFGYTVLSDHYYEAIQNWMKKRFHWEIEKDWIVFCPRISIAVSLMVQTLTKEGESVIIQQPVYSPLREAVVKNNRKLIVNPLKYEDEKYTMDFDDLEKKIDSSVKLMILCSPHNPVGRVWKKEELKKLEKLCVKHDIIVISDEIHSDLLYKGYEHTPLANVSEEMAKRSIICNSVTKTFNVPGVIVSNLIIPNKEIRKAIEDEIDRLGMHNPNIFSVPVVETAYTDCEEWVDEVLRYIHGNYEYFKEYVTTHMPKLKIIQPEGTYLLWIDYRALGLKEEEVYDWFIRKAKVGVYMGSVFGKEGEGFIRVNLATSRKNIELALERIKKFY
ncbi:MalY/PatB family protein [Crassaminicella profunda]|uniref:MalY/PatB family protein n=1 Tax=Crassaminicella profunda TaxID=1286698 RepID=UPI001CA61716|nr:MalY/PatB family protein [Crassaminicella profunda]QZY54453.1 pyridoxal phosphate-dependent aminotransferase [Crassaminicella profunda]